MRFVTLHIRYPNHGWLTVGDLAWRDSESEGRNGERLCREADDRVTAASGQPQAWLSVMVDGGDRLWLFYAERTLADRLTVRTSNTTTRDHVIRVIRGEL